MDQRRRDHEYQQQLQQQQQQIEQQFEQLQQQLHVSERELSRRRDRLGCLREEEEETKGQQTHLEVHRSQRLGEEDHQEETHEHNSYEYDGVVSPLRSADGDTASLLRKYHKACRMQWNTAKASFDCTTTRVSLCASVCCSRGAPQHAHKCSNACLLRPNKPFVSLSRPGHLPAVACMLKHGGYTRIAGAWRKDHQT